MVWLRWRLRRLVKIAIHPLLLLFFVNIILGVVHRYFISSKRSENPPLFYYSKAFSHMSVCSERADQRGLNQKIISYSIYGNFSSPSVVNRYLKPLSKIVDQVSAIYPGMNNFQHHISPLFFL